MSESNPLIDKMFEDVSKPIIGTWYVFKCRCNKWSVQEVRVKTIMEARFKCKYCEKTTKIKQKKTWGLVLQHKGPFATPQEATKACQQSNGTRE